MNNQRENDMKMYPVVENKDVYQIKRKLKEPDITRFKRFWKNSKFSK